MKTLTTLKLEKVVTGKRGRPQTVLVWPANEDFTQEDVEGTLTGMKISKATISTKLAEAVKLGKLTKTVNEGTVFYKSAV